MNHSTADAAVRIATAPRRRSAQIATAIAASLALVLAPVVTTPATADDPLVVSAAAIDPLTVPDVTIVGTPVVGGPLTATLTATLPDGVAVAYQWRRGGAPIDGAQAADYTPVVADALTSIDVVATFTAEGFDPTEKISPAVTVAKATFEGAPTPTLSGTVRVGSAVTAVTGTWPDGTTFTYSWRFTDAKGVETVSSATTQVYTPTSNVVGRKLSVVVTGTAPGHNPASARSALVTIAPGIINAPTPKISGSAAVGSTLKAVLGTWGPADSIAYSWKRNGAGISGATSSSYKLTTADLGKKITLTVVVKRSGYTTVTRTSPATATVTNPFTKASTPTISGTARSGLVLTANGGTWSPTPTLTYQWNRNGVAVAGKTSKTYTLTSADVGTRITVTVTAKRTGYFTRTVTSAPTAAVTAATTATRDGGYKVGLHIAPGTYYAAGGNNCWFERRSDANYGFEEGALGYAFNWNWDFGGQKVVTIKASDKYFYTEECGTWRPVTTALRTSVGDGTFVVGSQMQTGVWEAVGPFNGEGCYVQLLTSFSGDPDTSIYQAGWVDAPKFQIRITSTVKGFTSDGCGAWKRVP